MIGGKRNRISMAAARRGDAGYVVASIALYADDERLLDELQRRLRISNRSEVVRRGLRALAKDLPPAP